MATELTSIIVRQDTDILLVHETALKLARQAGLSPSEQVRFAAAVAENCAPEKKNGLQIRFSIYKKEEDRHFLRVTADEHSQVIEREVPQISNLQTFDSAIDLKENDNKQKEERFSDMQQFTYAISHDLKNSLTKLKLAIALLEDENLQAPVKNYVQIIHRASQRLENTMVSLNQVIQLGHSSSEVVKKISPSEIFADVLDDFSGQLQQANATVTVDFASLDKINYVAVYLRSVFTNLLSNAIKYAEPDRFLELFVSAYKKGNEITFIFKDNGQGMDIDKNASKLFQPFSRFSENSEGTGIGLYIVKNMVSRNGGSIKVESTTGKGTTFSVIVKEY